MLYSESGGLSLHETSLSLFSEVTKMVRDEIDLLEVSSRCRVNPTTLRKILEERPISRYIEKKIRAGLRCASPGGRHSSRLSTVQRLRELHQLYREKGTLAAVGRTTGLSRERVRQLLVRGAKIGLFEYNTWRFQGPSREKILDDYKKFLKLSVVAKANHLSMAALNRLRLSYQITQEELAEIRDAHRRMACIDLYICVAQELGHHPTVTELLRLKGGRSLHWQIRRGWGSVGAFRNALKIPLPPRKGLRGAACQL